jgi:hypothetical protein
LRRLPLDPFRLPQSQRNPITYEPCAFQPASLISFGKKPTSCLVLFPAEPLSKRLYNAKIMRAFELA